MTSASPLRLRRLSTVDADVARLLGRGLELRYRVGEQAGHLQLTPLRPGAVPVDGTALQTRSGWLWMTDASAALSVFGSVPAMLGGEFQAWYWQHFNQGLAPELQAVLGHVEPLLQPLLAPPGALACALHISLGEQALTVQLHASAATWLGLIEAADWQPLLAPFPEQLRLRAPVVLGRSGLTLSALRSLRPADVVLIEQPIFDTDGHGQVRLGPWRCYGQLQGHGLELSFTLHQLEHVFVEDDDYYSDPAAADDTDAAYGDEPHEAYGAEGYANDVEPDPLDDTAPGAEQAPFDGLTLNLTLRCGHLAQTVQQLRQLGPGSVLPVPGMRPGSASLYYGERAVAHGELVDIDGQLGVQITRMEPL